MWPFNRKKKDQSVYPQEVQNYYQAENRERTGVAWLLAIGTLIGTILLAAALFFGGRWVYRTVFDNDSNDDTSQTQNGQVGNGSATDDQTQDDQDDATPSDDDTSVLPGDGSNEDSSEIDNTDNTPPPVTQVPSPSSEELPNTGPSDDN